AGSSSATDRASCRRHPRNPPPTRTGGLAPPGFEGILRKKLNSPAAIHPLWGRGRMSRGHGPMPNDEPIAPLFLSPEPLTPAWYGADAPAAALPDGFVEQGDQAAFRALVGRHGPMVLGVCRRILRDPHAAEDAFQATFLLLVRKAGSVRNRGSVGPWLYGVARRVALEARGADPRRPAPAPLDAVAPRARD